MRIAYQGGIRAFLFIIATVSILPSVSTGGAERTQKITEGIGHVGDSASVVADTFVAWGIGEVTNPALVDAAAKAQLQSHLAQASKVSDGAAKLAVALRFVQLGLIAYDCYQTYGEEGFVEAFNTGLRGSLTWGAGWAGAVGGAKVGAAGGAAATVWFFGAGGLIGGAIGGAAGGIMGGFGSSWAVGAAYDKWLEEIIVNDLGPALLRLFKGEGSELLYVTTSSAYYAGSFYRTDTTRLDDAREGHLVGTKAAALDLSRRLARHDVDVLFLADNTGSMSGEIAEVKLKAAAILDALAGSDPRFQNVNIQWGVGRYSDDQIANPGKPGYELLQPITDDKVLVEAALNQWNSSWGWGIESAFWALQQGATNGEGTPRYPSNPAVATGQETGWRDGAARVIVLFGDEPSQQESINEKELRKILGLENVRVSIIDSGTQDGGNTGTTWDATSGQQLPGAAQEIADGTGGAYIRLIDTSQLVESIMNAVYDAVTDNVRTGGQLTRIDASKTWRYRTPSAVTADTPDDGNTFEFTLRYPGQTDSTFSVDMTAGTTVPGKTYLERTAIGEGTDVFGADLSSDVLVQFTPEKDFIRFLLSDGAAAAIEGYYGYRLPSSAVPSSGISIFDVSSRSVSPYDGLSYSSGELDTRLFVNWTTGKVFGIDRASPHPGSGVGIFLGTVDEESREIDGTYTAKTSRYSTSEPGIVPRFIEDTRRGNTNLRLYGEEQVAGIGGTFSVNWYNEAQTPSYTSMLMAGFKDDDAPTYTSISNGESWQGFAVGIVHDRSNGDMTIATNETADDVRMTFQPGVGEFAGSISVSDGTSTYSLATSGDDSAYVSPQAFGAVKRVSASAHIATTMNGVEEYDYLSWGSWSVDAGTSPEKSVFAHSPWIAGRLTPGNQIPTVGTATYNGSAWGQLNDSTGFTSVAGDAALTANYGTRTLSGSFSNMKRADGSAWTDVGVNASWGSANNRIAGTTSAPGGLSGAVNGAFFGPAAQEVGGNWTLQGGATQAAGVFTGKK